MNRNLQRKNVDIGGGVTAMSGGKIGDMTALTTSEKSTLVGAVNEVNSKTTTVEQIREVMQSLPDGSAVSAQVALNTAKVSELEGEIDNGILIEKTYLIADNVHIGGYVRFTSTSGGRVAGSIDKNESYFYTDPILIKGGCTIILAGFATGGTSISLLSISDSVGTVPYKPVIRHGDGVGEYHTDEDTFVVLSSNINALHNANYTIIDKDNTIKSTLDKHSTILDNNFKKVVYIDDTSDLQKLQDYKDTILKLTSNIIVDTKVQLPDNCVLDISDYHIGFSGAGSFESPNNYYSAEKNITIVASNTNVAPFVVFPSSTTTIIKGLIYIENLSINSFIKSSTIEDFSDGWEGSLTEYDALLKIITQNIYSKTIFLNEDINNHLTFNTSHLNNPAYTEAIVIKGDNTHSINNDANGSIVIGKSIKAYDCCFDGVTFVCVDYNNLNVLDVEFNNCSFNNCTFISKSSPNGEPIPNIRVTFRNNTVKRSYFYFVKLKDSIIEYNSFEGNDRTTVDAKTSTDRGMFICGASNVSIHNNIFTNLMTGIHFNVLYGSYNTSQKNAVLQSENIFKTTNIHIENNQFYNILEECITLDSGTAVHKGTSWYKLQSNILKVKTVEDVQYYSAGRTSPTNAKSKALIEILAGSEDDFLQMVKQGGMLYKMGTVNVGDLSYIKNIVKKDNGLYEIESKTADFFKNADNSVLAVLACVNNINVINNRFSNFGASTSCSDHVSNLMICHNIMTDCRLGDNYAFLRAPGSRKTDEYLLGFTVGSKVCFINNTCNNSIGSFGDIQIGSRLMQSTVPDSAEIQELKSNGKISDDDIALIHCNDITVIGNTANTMFISNVSNVKVYGNITRRLLTDETPYGAPIYNEYRTIEKGSQVLDDGVWKTWDGGNFVE